MMRALQLERFGIEARALLRRLGAKPIDQPATHQLVIDTKAGPLSMTVRDGWIEARFDDRIAAFGLLYPDPARATLGGRLSIATGRWDFHFNPSVTVDSALRYVEAEMRQVLP